jgi:glycosyltransferase involved in cell wall biosynthesis
VRDIVRAERPDLAHVSNVFPYLSPSLYHALAAHRVPVVQTLHNFRPLCPNSLFYTHGEVCLRCKDGRVWNAVLRRCVRNRTLPSLAYALAVGFAWASGAYPRKLGTVLTLNDFTARLWAERIDEPQNPPEVLGNYIDASRFTPREAFDPRLLVYLGRLAPEKGVLTLLRAMRRLPEFRLELMGDGLQEPELRAFVARHQLENVVFAGRLGPERFDRLARALALVLPSESHDQFPLTILEAYALGVPVLASRMGGIPSLVSPGETGDLFPAGDDHALAAAVRQLSSDPQRVRALGGNARRRVDAHHTPEAFYARLMEIYRRTLESWRV